MITYGRRVVLQLFQSLVQLFKNKYLCPISPQRLEEVDKCFRSPVPLQFINETVGSGRRAHSAVDLGTNFPIQDALCAQVRIVVSGIDSSISTKKVPVFLQHLHMCIKRNLCMINILAGMQFVKNVTNFKRKI